MTTVEIDVDQLVALATGKPAQQSAPLAHLLDSFHGRTVVVRTVTMTVSGRLTGHDGTFMALSDAAWIADSGRWADALKSGTFAEVEPFPDGTVLVSLGGIIDVVAIASEPPRSQK